jgi:hypothetical protein
LNWQLAVTSPITYIEEGLQKGVIFENDRIVFSQSYTNKTIKFQENNRLNNVSKKLVDLKITHFKKTCYNYSHFSMKSAECQLMTYKEQAAAIFIKSKEDLNIKSCNFELI